MIETLPPLELVKSRRGFVKVKLTYLTHKPVHMRSLFMREELGFDGPFLESKYVMMPQYRTFPLLYSFIPAFTLLRKHRIVEQADTLEYYSIVESDQTSLAYVIEL